MLLAATSVLHFWRIGSAPPGFFSDESAHAYNAYCIAKTGADEYGVSYPLFFRSFGEFKDPVMVYSLVPAMKVFGLQRWASRFPSGLYLIASSVAFALLVQWYCRNNWLSLMSGFCFSVMPWVFTSTRWTMAYAPMLLGMTLGWLLTLLALEKQSYRHAIGAGMAWAFAMYSYSVGRPMTVLFLICFGVSYFRELKKQWKLGLALVISWVVCLTPLIVAAARNPQVLTSRFQMVSVFRDNPSWDTSISRVVARYLEYFGPQFLFLRGDPNLRQHTGFGGELFRFLLPMVVAGLYCLVRRVRTQASYRFLGLGLLVFPIAATLTTDPRHSGRCVDGVIIWALIAAIGAHFLWQKRDIGRKLLIVTCVAGVIEVALYLRDYFGEYQVRSYVAFSGPYVEALQDCFRVLGTGDTLYVSPNVCYPIYPVKLDRDFKPAAYADILFFGKIEPQVYQRSGIPRNRVRLYEGKIDSPGLLLRTNVRLVERAQDKLVEIPDPIPAGAKLLETKPVSGVVRYEIYQVK
jgi:4-amino-4-deoxy-L-arabinose transferase-like glycosyltransferase